MACSAASRAEGSKRRRDGCLTQIASGTAIPVVHTVELIDWATGGPLPEPLAKLVGAEAVLAAAGG